jgi:fermentation-respiration switch protein FrsA (DUF1100 family)
MRTLWTSYLAGVIVCLFAAETCAQFYYPDRREYQTPDEAGLGYESITFDSEDGTQLHGWFIPATLPALGTVIHFHGNAQNLTAHFSFVKWLPEEGFNLLLFDYRGYGRSKGKPSRIGVHQDAIAALQYAVARDDIDSNSLLVLGQSLGGAVAITALASSNAPAVCGIAVESTFDSFTAIAGEKAPAILVALAVSDALSPIAVVANLAPTPILFIHGTSDKVVPYRRGKALYAAAEEPKGLWTVKGGRHTEALTTYGKIYRQKLVRFFRECLEEGNESQSLTEAPQ